MYGIFTHIYYKNQLVGKCTSPMDPMGNELLGFFGFWFLALEGCFTDLFFFGVVVLVPTVRGLIFLKQCL